MFASIRGLTVELMVRSASRRRDHPPERAVPPRRVRGDPRPGPGRRPRGDPGAPEHRGVDLRRRLRPAPRHDRDPGTAADRLGGGPGGVPPDGAARRLGILTGGGDTEDLRPGAHQELPAWGERSESMAPHRTEGALKITTERKPRRARAPNTQQESRVAWLSCCSPSPQAGVDAFRRHPRLGPEPRLQVIWHRHEDARESEHGQQFSRTEITSWRPSRRRSSLLSSRGWS